MTSLSPRFKRLREFVKDPFGTLESVLDRETQKEVLLRRISQPEALIEKYKDLLLKSNTFKHLRHENICGIIEGVAIGKSFYILQEFDAPELLKSRLQDKQSQGQSFEIAEVEDLLLSLFGGLSYLYSQQIFHGHLMLTNIFTAGPTVKIADSFLLQCLPKQHVISQLSKDIKIRVYIAPEILEGKELDQRVDVFSLGIIIGELLFNKIITYELVRPTGRLKDVYDVLKTATRANPSERFGTLKAFFEAFFNTIQDSQRLLNKVTALEINKITGKSTEPDLLHEIFEEEILEMDDMGGVVIEEEAAPARPPEKRAPLVKKSEAETATLRKEQVKTKPFPAGEAEILSSVSNLEGDDREIFQSTAITSSYSGGKRGIILWIILILVVIFSASFLIIRFIRSSQESSPNKIILEKYDEGEEKKKPAHENL